MRPFQSMGDRELESGKPGSRVYRGEVGQNVFRASRKIQAISYRIPTELRHPYLFNIIYILCELELNFLILLASYGKLTQGRVEMAEYHQPA